MTYVDLAIIYLACGAPLSMHYFFGLRGKLTVYFVARGILATLFWPVGVVSLLVNASRDRAKRVSASHLSDTDTRLDAIRIKIENLVFKNENAASVFEFREVFARYTGLIQAANTCELETDICEIFRLSGHSNVRLATRCSNRNSYLLLLSHAENSRMDFIALIDSVSLTISSAVNDAAIQAADLLGDHQTVLRLGELSENATRSNVEKVKNFGISVSKRTHVTQN